MSCTIYLDNYQGQYHPGNTVIGRVICSFNSPKNVRGIRLKLRGKEHNSWTELESYYDSHDKKTKTRTVHLSGNHTFFYVETTLIGEGEIPAGRYEYPFTFNLPDNLPGSYDGRYGWIRFLIKATVDRPFKFDYEDEKVLHVVSPIDFNKMASQLQLNPVAYSDDKTLCCCCCASDPITMKVHLEKEAFVVGETAKVNVEITNMANDNVEGVEVELAMTVTSKVTTPKHRSKEDRELLAVERDSGVGAHGERSYNFELEIPSSAGVPNFNLCTLFSVEYKLKVTAGLPGCHSDLDISAYGITLGHIPIGGQAVFQQVNLQQTANAVPPYMPPQDKYAPVEGAPYPPNAYPPDGKPPPYPAHFPLPTSPSQITPVPVPPSSGAIGFSIPQSTTSLPSSQFPALPAGGLLPNSPPYPPAAGPSAPPMDDSASAPPKEELAAGDQDFVMVGEDRPLIGGTASSNQLPPPSYNEAVSYPPK